MISIDEFGEMLDEIAQALPLAFYRELNGGILLLPEVKRQHDKLAGELYTMGEYHMSSNMGRYIIIYYGSFAQVYSHLHRDQLREELKQTLLHEFTHHLEDLAGERGLEIKDAQDLARYRRGQQ